MRLETMTASLCCSPGFSDSRPACRPSGRTATAARLAGAHASLSREHAICAVRLPACEHTEPDILDMI